MQDELARVVVGLPVASLWPLTVPDLATSRPRVALAAAASALYVLAPQIPSLPSCLLLLAAACIPAALWPLDNQETKAAGDGWRNRLASSGPVLAPLLLALAAVALIDLDQGWEAVEGVVESERVVITAAGFIATVFLGGSLVAWILGLLTRPWEEGDEASKLPSLANAGRYIGWFERAVLFAFVIGGEPEAAAVALAAKSFARFPTLSEHHEGFAEYFLIGSLASLTVAVAGAAATRAALGIGSF
jgi:hypothetical protein